jgi:chemotaxis protein CheD
MASNYLKPGELAVAERPALVSTVLGSCVAVTLFSPRLGVGAICHAMLPMAAGRPGFKFVDSSLQHMLQRFVALGVAKAELVAKLFGGADMFQPTQPSATQSVGRQNIQAATTLLQQQGVRLAAADTGGRQGRKLLFYSHTGEVLLKRLGQHTLD